ncbi:MAG: TfpX/TfpZ family type IV pilin accessory protein [Methyloglobulus sp.]|nr:hypothetical protein [Methyloglobulus sp.]
MQSETILNGAVNPGANNALAINRYQAFGIHLLGSVLIALASAALVFFLWYPAPLAEATGVTNIYLLLLAVDVVIGPFITLIVFNPAKKELKRDLLIVLLLQIAALLYGLHTVFITRPVYAVYNASRFDLVYANDLTDEKLAKVTHPLFKSPPLWGSETIAVRWPADEKLRTEILMNAITGKGDDLPLIPQYYVPYADEKAVVIKQIKPMESLRQLNTDRTQEIDALSQRYTDKKAGIGYLPLIAKLKDLTVIVAIDSAEVLEINTLKPR